MDGSLQSTTSFFFKVLSSSLLKYYGGHIDDKLSSEYLQVITIEPVLAGNLQTHLSTYTRGE